MKRFFTAILLLIVGFSSVAFSKQPTSNNDQQTILIRLFASYNISSINFFHVSGEYSVYGDSTKLFEVDKISFISVSLLGDSVILQKPNYTRKFRLVRFVP